MKGRASGFTAYTATGAIKVIAQSSGSISQSIMQLVENNYNDDSLLSSPGNLSGPSPLVFTFTTTGNIDDLNFQNAPYIRANNASLATIRGLKAGYDGQEVTIFSIGAGEVDFANQNASSSAANRLINFVTSGVTPLAAGVGVATYKYDLTTARWRLKDHQQGDFINVPFSAGNFTTEGAGTWTVGSGDQVTYAFFLNGRSLYVQLAIETTTVVQSGGSPTQLRITLPNGYVAANTPTAVYRALDNGVNVITTMDIPATSFIRCFATVAGTQWANSTDQTYILGEIFTNIS